MRLIAALLMCLSLAACIDADVTMDFTAAKTGGETVAVDADLTLSRELHDLLGEQGNLCRNGTEVLGKRDYTCQMSKTLTLEEVLAKGGQMKGEGKLDMSDAARIERVDDNHLRITFDFAGLMDKGGAGHDDLAGMEGMLRAAMAGHSLSFHIKGHRITETTGTLSEDGTTASRILPVTAFLDAEPDLGAPFVTVVQLRQSCTLWIFCD